jgi:hypothetical protein
MPHPPQFRFVFPLWVLAIVLLPPLAARSADDDSLRAEASEALRRAAEYYREKVAVRGGYVYHTTPDLARRWGEGLAGPQEIWVQPPGTPTVGMAYLAAWRATSDQYYLDAADAAADALLYGQLKSGGWTNSVDFDPAGPRVAQYKNGQGKGRNYSTLDDGISQSAIRFLARLDEAHKFEKQPLHDAVTAALNALLAAQYPCGAFPQVWIGPVPQEPPAEANFPDYDWRTEGRVKNYWDMYTLNDGLAGTVAATLMEAHAVYGDERFKQALVKLGDFLIRAQLPDPQPAWAQQYDYQMRPIWARKFEPPAVTGGESQDVLETLLTIYRATGDAKYLEPIPRALEYLKKSQLPSGQLARYYELQTNRPLYMTRRGEVYSLTYDDTNLPDHYGWKVDSRLAAIEREYAAAKGTGDGGRGTGRGGQGSGAPQKGIAAPTADEVRAIIAARDEQGRWVSKYTGERLVGQPKFRPGDEYLSSAVFSQNVEVLSRFLAGGKR